MATLCIKITFVSSSYSILSAAQFLKIRGLIRQVDQEDNGNGLTLEIETRLDFIFITDKGLSTAVF